MQYRIDPKTGNKISALGFGCMRLPSTLGRIDIDKTEKLFLKAIDKGINYFDTAYIYPGSEAAIGQIFSKHGIRKEVFIATKLPLIMCRTREDFDKYFDGHLERLKTDYIDYYFMHMLGSPAQWQQLKDLGIEEWIEGKKAAGQIRQVGFSFHGQKNDFITLVDAYDWDFCQIQYNYMNTNYQAGVAGLKYAAQKGLPVFIMEPLLGGRLATGLPKKAETLFKSEDPAATPVSWALRWLWNHREVTMLLSGMNEFSQLDENIALAEKAQADSLTDQELAVIDQVIEAFNASYKIPCTGCNYCMPCPQNIDIPGCFASYNASYAISRSTGIQQYVVNTKAMSKSPASASDCIKCGKCEKHCPQNIPIRDSLDMVKKRMEPFWYKAAMAVARRVMR
ncbi:aldo/keto reductase [Eubacteriaceae bacterium ES3]|nr:aldo/keto reductase [Eubacteriaceae bacterium ES3]